MNLLRIVVAAAIMIVAIAVSSAEEIELGMREISNLGIELASPERAQHVAAIEATARVVIPPTGEVIVSAPQSGQLARLTVAVSDEVIRGQVLAEMQSPEFLSLQREFLDALNTNLLAQNDYERDRQLMEEGIVSGRRLQETMTRARIAATSLNEHRQLLQIAGLTEADIRSLETRQKLVRVLAIRAPFEGVILDRMAVVGERLDMMSPIFRIADLSLLWLEINVPQERLAAVQPGMKVAVEGSPIRFPAEVASIAQSIDPGTQAITVRAVLDEPEHGLKPGQFVSARIVADYGRESTESVWLVPAAAVTRSGDSHFLFVRTSTGFDIREAQVVGADAGRLYVRVDVAANSGIAVRGVSALKAMWFSHSGPES
jgi:cobalt-zinc-cadmium efflux system membrane fusion protein